MPNVFKYVKRYFVIIIIVVVALVISVFLFCAKKIRKVDIGETEQGQPIKRNLLE